MAARSPLGVLYHYRCHVLYLTFYSLYIFSMPDQHLPPPFSLPSFFSFPFPSLFLPSHLSLAKFGSCFCKVSMVCSGEFLGHWMTMDLGALLCLAVLTTLISIKLIFWSKWALFSVKPSITITLSLEIMHSR